MAAINTGHMKVAAENVDQLELNERCGLSISDLKHIAALSELEGDWSLFPRQTVFRWVNFKGRRFKVRAFASALHAHEQLALIKQAERLFAQWQGIVNNCLVTEYVQDSSVGKVSPEDIGGFIADLARIPGPPLSEKEFDWWLRILREKRVFLPSSVELLRTYFARALEMPIRWNLEYLDAVPKNFVYGDDGRIICIDDKHLHVGPEGLALAKLFCNIGEYCKHKDYVSIGKAYQERVPESRIEDPTYFELLVIFYYVYFLVRSAERLTWKSIIMNSRNTPRRREVLKIIGAPMRVRILEKLQWDMPRGLFWATELPWRLVRFLNRCLIQMKR